MFYWFMRTIAVLVVRVWYRVRISGRENIPKKGAFLLCANHISAWDPITLAAMQPRRLRFMAKKELFRKWIGNTFLRAVGAYPIDRSTADMQAFRTTTQLLKDGKAIIIFSQGTRMEGFDNVKNGVALFALRSGAPIVPVGIVGEYRFQSKIVIRIGEPIYMDEHSGKKVKTELIDEIMTTVVERVNSLTR